MVSPVFFHHVVGDLTVGKPDLSEFSESETVESAVRAISEFSEGAITVWRCKDHPSESVADRFVGILTSVELVAFIAAFGDDHERAMKATVSDVVVRNSSVLKEVDPGTRLIDALEMMKQGVQRLLVRKSIVCKGISKRFSVFYNGKWLKNLDSSANSPDHNKCNNNKDQPSSSAASREDKYCCLSREDVIRFLICCLGALNPIPLSSISSLGAIMPYYTHLEASAPAIEAVHKLPRDPCAVAVVEINSDGIHKIIGEISAYKLWKCDYSSAAWAMKNLSAGQFVMGGDDNEASRDFLPNFTISPPVEDCGVRPKKFSSRSIGFFSSQVTPTPLGGGQRSMYRGRSSPLICKHTSSLAAVMAQMLSHRATHVWVTKAGLEDDILIGIVSYNDVLHAVTKQRSTVAPMIP